MATKSNSCLTSQYILQPHTTTTFRTQPHLSIHTEILTTNQPHLTQIDPLSPKSESALSRNNLVTNKTNYTPQFFPHSTTHTLQKHALHNIYLQQKSRLHSSPNSKEHLSLPSSNTPTYNLPPLIPKPYP